MNHKKSRLLLFLCLVISPTYFSGTNTQKTIDDKITEEKIRHLKKLIQLKHADHPYANKQATVRIGNTLCQQEKEFFKQRIKHVKRHLEQVLGTALTEDQVPSIAICGSGGGYRALVSLLGGLSENLKSDPQKRNIIAALLHFFLDLFNAFEPENDSAPSKPENLRLGLLDIATYCSGVSGSSWALAGLIQSHKNLDDYLNHLGSQLNNHILENFDLQDVMITLLRKYAYDQPMSLIDIFGALIAQKLLNDIGYENPNEVDIASQATLLTDGCLPMPIYTAVIGEDLEDYEWVEFTPFEVGSKYLNSYIPTWAFGRKFENGLSQDDAPPQSLGYCMGIWGSAMSVNTKEFFDKIIDPGSGEILEQYLNSNFGSLVSSGTGILQSIFSQIRTNRSPFGVDDILEYRLSPARVFNWTKNISGLPLNNERILTLIDGGIDHNLGLSIVLDGKRSIDILIVFDACDGEQCAALKKAELHAKERGIPFPVIDYSIAHQPCSVHEDNDPNTPILIYLPLRKSLTYHDNWDPREQDFTNTFNFEYTQEETKLLSGLEYHNVHQSKKMIIDTIRKVALEKKSTP